MSKSYSDLFKDPRWQKKRLEILQRDNWTCQKCGNKEDMLVVHHTWYGNIKEKNNKNGWRKRYPWEYENECLITLCKDCHEIEHDKIEDVLSDLNQTLKNKGFISDDIAELVGLLAFKDKSPKEILEVISKTLSGL